LSGIGGIAGSIFLVGSVAYGVGLIAWNIREIADDIYGLLCSPYISSEGDTCEKGNSCNDVRVYDDVFANGGSADY
jgi:hypothetical protein